MRTGTSRFYITSADQIANAIITQEKLAPVITVIKVRAYRATSDQAIAATAWTKVEFNGESYDPNNRFDPVTNYRFTLAAVQDGYYLINASIKAYNTVTAGYALIAIYKNGAIVSEAMAQLTLALQGIAVRITDYLPLVAGDYIEIWIYLQNAGVIGFGEIFTWLDVVRLF